MVKHLSIVKFWGLIVSFFPNCSFMHKLVILWSFIDSTSSIELAKKWVCIQFNSISLYVKINSDESTSQVESKPCYNFNLDLISIFICENQCNPMIHLLKTTLHNTNIMMLFVDIGYFGALIRAMFDTNTMEINQMFSSSSSLNISTLLKREY